jgi:hypothetical protein
MANTRIPLTDLKDVQAALKLGPVFCDIASPSANKIPVRDVRRFRADKALDGIPTNDPLWISRHAQGIAVGFEVQVLEGWRIPERVYTEKK